MYFDCGCMEWWCFEFLVELGFNVLELFFLFCDDREWLWVEFEFWCGDVGLFGLEVLEFSCRYGYIYMDFFWDFR